MPGPKENLPETVRKDGRPDRLPVCFAPFRPIGGEPVFRFVRGNRVRGTDSYDRRGTHMSFPGDRPAAVPVVTPENRAIRNIGDIPALSRRPDGRMALMGGSASVTGREDSAEEEIRRALHRALSEYGRLTDFIPGETCGGPGTLFPHVLPISHEEIEEYNKARFGA